MRCPSCSTESLPHFKFCGQCGTPLAAPAEGGRAAAERRQLTVMFCDLVGSTALAGRLDPEDLREVLREYQAVCAGTVARFDGSVAQYLGDGILAYFGYPRAHEDDPRHAVAAGLEILADMARLSARCERERGVSLAVRVGVHTGIVVTGEIGSGSRREDLAVGETPNVAARLQAQAQPNTLLVSAATHRLVQGYFTGKSLGTLALKGVAQPVAAYHVTGQTEASSRLDAADAVGLTTLVGRDRELARLRQLWQQAREGAGCMVLLSGEAGIGKSRLAGACADADDAAGFTRLRYFCSEHHTRSPLYPVARQLERAAGFARGDPPELRLAKLETLLAAAGGVGDFVLIAELLSLAVPGPALDLSPQRRREMTFAALLRQVEAIARRGPVLLIFEDAHWIDPSTLELLERMAARLPALPMLAIVTFRPEYRPKWAQAESIELGRLDAAQRRALVRQVGGAALAEHTVGEIAERSDGIPLFVEELTRTMVEVGGGPSAASAAVPETLHSSLMARLDRLGAPVKEIAQIGAAIGRQFYYRLLAAVSGKSEPELLAALRALGEAELLTCRGEPPEATYMFKHALVQDAAYDSLLRGRRRELHSAIARELEARHAEGVGARALLAHHCTRAGLHREAVRAWRSAAREGVERGSFEEAEAQLRTGLELLAQQSRNAERDRQEVTLQNALGNVLIARKGYTAAETLAAFERARSLAADLSDPGQGLRALWGLGAALLFAGRPGAVLEMMKDAAPLVEKNGHLDGRLAFSVVHGSVLLDLGRLVEACEQLERTLAMDSEPGRDRERAILYGQSPRISALAHLSIASLIRGRAPESLEQSRRSLREAHSLAHKPMLCLAYSVACRRHWLARDREALAESAAALQRLAAEQGTPLWMALGRMHTGWSLAEQQRAADGIALMGEAVREYRASGAGAGMPLFLLAIGSACARAGRTAEALDSLAEALEGGGAGEERWVDAEIHREHAEVLAAQGELGSAQAAFRKAIEVANAQGALLFEARAKAGLERAVQMQGGA